MSPWWLSRRAGQVERTYRILVVAEAAPVRALIAPALHVWEQFVVDIAATGREAITRAQEHDYDLIILDDQLGDMESTAVCQVMCQKRPVRVLGISGQPPPPGTALLAAGYAACLAKPLTVTALLEHVAHLLGLPLPPDTPPAAPAG